MAIEIELDDARIMLNELGFTSPDSLLELYVAQANSLDSKLDGAGYKDETQKLIKLYLVAILAISSGARRIKSESAPSGASRTFEYGNDVIGHLKSAIRGIDQKGCADELLPKDKAIGFFDVVGGC
ncbi:hypothetical protein Q7267_09355 [Glaesserella parasuis]|uniref:Uncharacterized protein n=2 Tax=Glaesserella parasuis TaxID=738 RepID=A0A806JA10_GLAPU|nr:hypothetical protein [Glaesserella parasuis]AGO15621.1 hypothetical protein K756_01785 [Glaesserella parasuis ZJ0906]AIK16562.1 hypothetical protein JL26_01310 [Glaesserella parasuis]MCT8608890.1 hypothetical protein [Glaesserella parasuis]MDD2164579.1 hypothetical protein [Glaesserella parasuis]MDE4002134.1 hypothetical protein [Glaesserella parasuis]